MDDACYVKDTTVTISEVALIKKYDLSIQRKPLECDHDYVDIPVSAVNLSQFKEATVSYIAGFTGRMTSKSCLFQKCSDSLGSPQNVSHSAFLRMKDSGGLFKPSPSVIAICEETEKKFQRILSTTGGKLPQGKGITDAIASSVLEDITLAKTFPELHQHMLDTAVQDNHVFQLIKIVSRNYSKIRMYRLGKELTNQVNSDKVRKNL